MDLVIWKLVLWFYMKNRCSCNAGAMADAGPAADDAARAVAGVQHARVAHGVVRRLQPGTRTHDSLAQTGTFMIMDNVELKSLTLRDGHLCKGFV